MVKLAIAVIYALFVCQGHASPLVTEDGDINKAAAAGNWAEVQRLLKEYVESGLSAYRETLLQQTSNSGLDSQKTNIPAFTAATMQGTTEPRGRYYSQREYQYMRSSNDNGVISQDKGGLGVIDDNGRVTYYKPNTDSSAGNNGYSSGFAPYGH